MNNLSKTPLMMNVVTFDAAAGENADAEQDLIVDISGTQSRIWLSSFVAWCMHENKIIEIYPAPGKEATFHPKIKYDRRRPNVSA